MSLRSWLRILPFVGTMVVYAQTPARFDVILRGGTVVDGTGRTAFTADVGIRNGYILRIGDLSQHTARTELDVSGLVVSPGFLNIHSHAQPEAISSAVNMLSQGVTTEIINADGAGAKDLQQQLREFAAKGHAVNVGRSSASTGCGPQ